MSKARELSKLPNYVLSTVAELKLAVGKEQGDKAFVGGYYADGDGGGGDFYWDAVSVEADNGGTIFQVTGTTTGRWKRIYSGTINVKWFGAIGNSTTGDDAVFQLALDYIHKISDDTGVSGKLEWTGAIYLTTPKYFGKNIELIGGGRSFKSTIIPLASFVGSSLFIIDGTSCIGGYAFRIRMKSFTIDNSLIATKAQIAKTIYIANSYDILFDDVWLYNIKGTGIEVSTSNLVILNNLSVYGTSASTTASEYGVRVLSAGTSAAGGGVKIINPDIEVMYKGISIEGDARVDIENPYLERNITGLINTNTTSGSLTVVGGQIESPSASGIAANINGANATIIGGIYKANGGLGLYVDPSSRKENIKILGVSGNISDINNYSYKEVSSGTAQYKSEVSNYKTPADNTPTTFFNIVCPYVASYFGKCVVTIDARDASGYSLWTANYVFAFSNPDGTLRTTAVVEYGKTNINISANYSLAITAALSNSGTTISFQITANTGGALGEGTVPRVSASAELTQWHSTGAVYIQAI